MLSSVRNAGLRARALAPPLRLARMSLAFIFNTVFLLCLANRAMPNLCKIAKGKKKNVSNASVCVLLL